MQLPMYVFSPLAPPRADQRLTFSSGLGHRLRCRDLEQVVLLYADGCQTSHSERRS